MKHYIFEAQLRALYGVKRPDRFDRFGMSDVDVLRSDIATFDNELSGHCNLTFNARQKENGLKVSYDDVEQFQKFLCKAYVDKSGNGEVVYFVQEIEERKPTNGLYLYISGTVKSRSQTFEDWFRTLCERAFEGKMKLKEMEV